MEPSTSQQLVIKLEPEPHSAAATESAAVHRAAAEAQLPWQQLPALTNMKKEAVCIDSALEFADVLYSSGNSDAVSGSEEEREPPEPDHRTRGLDGDFPEGGAAAPLQALRRFGLRQRAGPGAGSGQALWQSGAWIRPMRSARKKSLWCRQCSKGFVFLCDLQRHEREHSGTRPFVCPDCGAAFKRKAHLKRHSGTHSGEKQHCCAECGRGFAQLSTLQRHMLSHTGARPYACPDCGRRFSLAGNMRTHRWTVHFKRRSHACPDCGRRFRLKKNLRTHQLMHSGAQPHVCRVCGQRFSHSGSLHNHSAIHSEQKFTCDSCGRSFKLKNHLRRHVQIHLAPGGN